VPIEPAVAAGGDAGEPVVLSGTGPAADAFRAIARTIVTETVPPVAMAGCSARLLDAVEAALGPAAAPQDGAAAAPAPASGSSPRGAPSSSGSASNPSSLGRTTSMRPSPSRRSLGRMVGGRPRA